MKLALENFLKKSEKKCKKFKKFKKKFKLLKRRMNKINYNFFNLGFITENNNTNFTYKSKNVSSDEYGILLDQNFNKNFLVIGGTFYNSGFFVWSFTKQSICQFMLKKKALRKILKKAENIMNMALFPFEPSLHP